MENLKDDIMSLLIGVGVGYIISDLWFTHMGGWEIALPIVLTLLYFKK